MTSSTPFVVYDALVALYTTDASGLIATSLFLGGDAESIELVDAYKERTLYYPGVPTSTIFHEDEIHTIEMKNVWLYQTPPGSSPQMPTPYFRNVPLLLVIAWQDEDTGAWCNRTYTGVKGRGRTLEGMNTFQTLRYTAETMDETAGPVLLSDGGGGLTVGAALVPQTYGDLRYVAGGVSEIIYRYSVADATITPLDSTRPAVTATFTLAVGAASVFFGAAAPVLTATSAGLTINALGALGNTILDNETRVEFWLGLVRLATLSSDGTLAVRDVLESPIPPVGGMRFGTGTNWLFTLDTVTTARSFIEV